MNSLFKALRRKVDFNKHNRDRWISQVANDLSPHTKVIDIGAGQCPYKHLFRHCSYQTQDFCQYEGSSLLNEDPNWVYEDIDFVCDATSIPVPDSSYDIALCTEVLEHVSRPDMLLREISRILRPGGKAFITAPLGSGLHQVPFHFYGGFTPYFYEFFAREVGLNITEIKQNGGFFLFLLQEIDRSFIIIRAYSRNPFYSLFFVIGRLLFYSLLLPMMYFFEKRISTREFTVGYFVILSKGQ